MKKTLIAATLLSLFSSQYATASDETTELRQIIEQQQKVLKDLEKRLEQTEKRVETTADVVESTASSKSATTIGGYGELHYNNITDNNHTHNHNPNECKWATASYREGAARRGAHPRPGRRRATAEPTAGLPRNTPDGELGAGDEQQAADRW